MDSSVAASVVALRQLIDASLMSISTDPEQFCLDENKDHQLYEVIKQLSHINAGRYSMPPAQCILLVLVK